MWSGFFFLCVGEWAWGGRFPLFRLRRTGQAVFQCHEVARGANRAQGAVPGAAGLRARLQPHDPYQSSSGRAVEGCGGHEGAGRQAERGKRTNDRGSNDSRFVLQLQADSALCRMNQSKGHGRCPVLRLRMVNKSDRALFWSFSAPFLRTISGPVTLSLLGSSHFEQSLDP